MGGTAVSKRLWGTGRDDDIHPWSRGVEIDGRLVAFSANQGYAVAWGDWGYAFCGAAYPRYDPTFQFRSGINTIIFALTQEGCITKRVMDSVKRWLRLPHRAPLAPPRRRTIHSIFLGKGPPVAGIFRSECAFSSLRLARLLRKTDGLLWLSLGLGELVHLSLMQIGGVSTEQTAIKPLTIQLIKQPRPLGFGHGVLACSQYRTGDLLL